MQHQTHLVGGRLRPRCPVRCEMGLPGLDVIFRLAAGGIQLLVQVLAAAALEIGDDVAGVAPIGADLDPGDDTALFRPGPGRIEECLEPAQLLAGLSGVAGRR